VTNHKEDKNALTRVAKAIPNTPLYAYKTNYFVVTDEDAYSDLFDRLYTKDGGSPTDLSTINMFGTYVHCFACDEELLFEYEEGSDDGTIEDFMTELQEILPEDEPFVMISQYSTGFKHVGGSAYTVTPNEIEATSILEEIETTAQELNPNCKINFFYADPQLPAYKLDDYPYYRATTRTNSFRVTDEEKYQKTFEKLHCLNSDILPADLTVEKNGVKYHAFATCEYLSYDGLEGEEDFIAELQTILPADEVFVLVTSFMTDDFVSLTNTAFVANNREVRKLDIRDTAERMTSEMLNNPHYDLQYQG